MAGGRRETIEDQEILKIFQGSDDPVLFTSEVADKIEFSNQGTLPRLKDLEDRGYLDSKSKGHSLVWWITESGVEFLESDGTT